MSRINLTLARNQKRQYLGQIPKFWQRKIDTAQALDCKIIHWDLIDRFVTGAANAGDMWDWMETGFTYTQIMNLHAEDGREFTPEAIAALVEQIEIYASVTARHRTTGRVGFSGPELCIARAAAHVMDDLIDIDRHGIAVKATKWAIVQMDRIRALGGMAMRMAA